ncbi:MAG: homoserine kinase, partial [Candidatus Heimdallarchaeota archaeon]|nr:homoserine kinase [Candidatus Heimdallarchaeota archaeon]
YELVKYAIYGESVASKAYHGDNVTAALFGGLNLCSIKIKSSTSENITQGLPKIENVKVIELPFPRLYCVLIYPNIIIETKNARKIVKKEIDLDKHVMQSMYLSGFLVSCFTNDLELMQSSLVDIIIEPQRSALIPHFAQFKQIANSLKVIGFGISGAGPTMFALTETQEQAERLKEKYQSIKGLEFELQIWISEVSKKGAYNI